MRGVWAIFFSSTALAGFAFSVFNGPVVTTGGARHWAAAPLLAFSIVLVMGCLVVLSTGARGR